MTKVSDPGGSSALHTVVVLTLCAVFFLLAMSLTLLGSNIYRGVAASADQNYTARTSLSYVVNQVRRSDCGKVYIGEFEGSPALMLFENVDSAYTTLLYCHEGQLMELYVEAEYLDEFGTADGIPVMELESLALSLNGPQLTITADGRTVTISPRCRIEEVGAL